MSPSLAAGSLLQACGPATVQIIPLAALAIKFGSKCPFGIIVGTHTTPMTALVTKFNGRFPDRRLRAGVGVNNAIGGPCRPVWRGAPCQNTAVWLRRRQRRWRPLSPTLAAGSLLGCCMPGAAQKTLWVALTIKFGGRLHGEMLLAGGGADIAT